MHVKHGLHLGDSADVLQSVESDSIDLMATDPPYGYNFLGQEWDKTLPDPRIWQECLRTMKAGAFAFVMSAPRQDVMARMICDLTDAGFHMQQTPMFWAYRQGMPKYSTMPRTMAKLDGVTDEDRNYFLNAYVGFQPMPAVEVILVAQKPISEKSKTEQALKNKKGVTWMDDCRIPRPANIKKYDVQKLGKSMGLTEKKIKEKIAIVAKGKYPRNLLVSDDALNTGTKTKKLSARVEHVKNEKTKFYGRFKEDRLRVVLGDPGGSFSRHFDLDAWYSSRFLITPKPKKKELDTQGRQRQHTTVKPIKLMSYLITLASREGDTVLDPFAGSGTTAIAARQLRRKYICIEREQEYYNIAKNRIAGKIENCTGSQSMDAFCKAKN